MPCSASSPRRSGRSCLPDRRWPTGRGRDLLARIEAATQIPTAIMESPRGFNDATLGAFADAIRRADLIVLLGKAFDFTLKFGEPPAVDAACRWVVIDPEAALVERAVRERGERSPSAASRIRAPPARR